jgi:GTPase involved in cell partitioning and DNA repair
MLAHLISFENQNMLKAYKEIRKELEIYDQKNNLGDEGLAQKEEIIILTKTDVIEDQKLIAKKIKDFEKINKRVFTLSLYDDKSIKKLRDELVKILKKKLIPIEQLANKKQWILKLKLQVRAILNLKKKCAFI